MTAQALLFRIQLILDPATKNGQKLNDSTAAITISTATNATPIVVTTATNHGLVTGNQVYVTGVATNTAANNTGSNPNWTITVIDGTSFSLDDSVGNGAGTGGTATPALVGSVDGAAFARQRILDIYNQARMALFNALDGAMSPAQKIQAISGAIVQDTAFAFSSGLATKPTGFLQHIRLTTAAGVEVSVLPFGLVRQLKNRESATNPIVFDRGTVFESQNGSTYVSNASDYILTYFGVTNFTLANILGGSTVETFNENYYPVIIELAQAIAAEQGTVQINALAKKLIGA